MGCACNVTVNGVSGVKLTVVVPIADPLVAVMSAVPALKELSADVAMPFVVEAGAIGFPKSVAKLTLELSATALPY